MVPELPKLRPLDLRWVQQNGQSYLYLRDPLELSDHAILVPEVLVYLLALCDGSRDVEGIRLAFQLQTGIPLSPTQIKDFLSSLSGAILLEDDRYRSARQAMLDKYRLAPYRPPALANGVYPGEPQALTAALSEYCRNGASKTLAAPVTASEGMIGIISPHIDYQRGWRVYAGVWKQAQAAVQEAELAIIFGTDHSGGPGKLTLTRQSYATPLGVLPADPSIVGAVEEALGADQAYEEEIHHAKEHSVELASVWLHYMRGGAPCAVVPILCGSFHPYYTDERSPESDSQMDEVVDILKMAIARRKTVVIAAGDLAHRGPTFGDPVPLDAAARARLAQEDGELLEAVCRGDHEGLLSLMRQTRDRNRICGFPPIYMALRLLEGFKGSKTGYEQCPADADGGSLVSIAGVVLYGGQSTLGNGEATGSQINA